VGEQNVNVAGIAAFEHHEVTGHVRAIDGRRREIRQPYVVEIERRKFALGNAPRRTPDRTNPQTLMFYPPRTELDDSDRHDALLFAWGDRRAALAPRSRN
jgi:hypothetical protein